MANNNNEIKINVPEGMEIDRENSTFECIKFKKKSDILDGFKKGDFLYIRSKSDNEWYLIFSGVEKKYSDFHLRNITNVIAMFYISSDCPLCMSTSLEPLIEKSSIDVIRYATVGETQKILERLDKEGLEWDAENLELKKKPSLPKTWEEFCINTQIKEGEYYIDIFSIIVPRGCDCKRKSGSDKNILPNKKTAEAMLALCQLIQLRDHYNDGWEPDWKDARESKYCILSNEQCLEKNIYHTVSHVLAFKTAELRDQFLENFRDLIEIAKPLL